MPQIRGRSHGSVIAAEPRAPAPGSSHIPAEHATPPSTRLVERRAKPVARMLHT